MTIPHELPGTIRSACKDPELLGDGRVIHGGASGPDPLNGLEIPKKYPRNTYREKDQNRTNPTS